MELALDETIARYLSRYADFEFDFSYKEVRQGKETVSRPYLVSFRTGAQTNIEVSRGAQNIFIWCMSWRSANGCRMGTSPTR